MELYVHRWGSGPEVVLLHGSGHSSREAWVAQRPLTERWTLLAADRVGHGRSPDGRQDFEEDGRLVAEQLLDRPRHLVGFSYGGLAAMHAAALRPDGVRSLVLAEPPALGAAWEHPAVRALGGRLEAALAADDLPTVELGRAFCRAVGVRVALPDELTPSMTRAVEALRGVRRPDGRPPLGALRDAGFPVLVVSGGHDEGYEAVADAIAAGTGGRRAVVAGAAHLVAETGAPFNEVVEAFWREAG